MARVGMGSCSLVLAFPPEDQTSLLGTPMAPELWLLMGEQNGEYTPVPVL